MVERTLHLLECDMDGSDDQVESYIIEHGGIHVKVDLCAKHGKPIRAAMEAGRRLNPEAGEGLDPRTRAALDRNITP